MFHHRRRKFHRSHYVKNIIRDFVRKSKPLYDFSGSQFSIAICSDFSKKRKKTRNSTNVDICQYAVYLIEECGVKPDDITEGKVDLIRGKGDTVEIVDFKSRRKPDAAKDREMLERYRRQLHIDAPLAEERTGKKVSRMNLYYTAEEDGTPTITYPYTKSAVEETMSEFDDTVRKIMQKAFHHCANDPKVCDSCDFRFYCRAKK